MDYGSVWLNGEGDGWINRRQAQAVVQVCGRIDAVASFQLGIWTEAAWLLGSVWRRASW